MGLVETELDLLPGGDSYMRYDAYRALTHRKGMDGTSINCVKLKLQIITRELKLFVAVLPYPAVWRMFIFLIN